MSQLITLSKLAALVSENTGIELTVCNAFIRNLSQAVAAALVEGEHVRIKNFGLFEARQSPEGNITVEFVPETVFSERVNAPFAHLRPMVAQMSAPKTPVNSQAPAYPTPAQPAAPQPIQTPQPEFQQTPAYPTPAQPAAPQPAQTPQPEFPQASAYTTPTQPAAPQPTPTQQPEFPQASAYPTPTQPAAPQPTPTQQPEFPQAPAYHTPAQPAAPQPAQTQQPEFPQAPAYHTPAQPDTSGSIAFPGQQHNIPQQDPTHAVQQQDTPQDVAAYVSLPGIDQYEPAGMSDPSPSDTYDVSDSTSTVRKLPQISTNKKYVLIGIMGLIAGFTIGYLVGHNSSSENAADIPVESPATVSSASATPAVTQEYDYESSVSVADIDSLIEEEAPDTPQPQPATENITVKLQKGQRLSDIAQKYYGHKDYWVYIYFENRKNIANPFTIREGTILSVPPKEKYAQTTDEATNLQWAKAKGAEINNKYL